MGAEHAMALLERFEIRRPLGQGGHGVVSEAYDVLRKETVALKSLQRVGGEALYRFKREFRSLAGLSHPNLVTLYELFASGEHWYFTMELVAGSTFVDWVRGRDADRDLPETIDVPREPVTVTRARDAAPEAAAARASAATYARLRHAARQVAQALHTLHEAGWKHGDVKPSNVLVTDEGRVVVLDFGVITELDAQALEEVAGTPIYMAPEQVRCEPVTAASDWYSLGVMLFECMTGRRPMEGGALTVMSVKARAPRVPASEELPEDAPSDLRALCVDLLRAEPEERPVGREVLARLGASASLAPPAPAAAASVDGDEHVGRRDELARLHALLADVDEARGRAALVHAPSGMGKTELVDVFLASLASRTDLVVLRGRCYEREAVPYKALDSFVDGLVRWLRPRPMAEVEALLPDDVAALAAAFPVLKRLDAVGLRTSAAPLYFEQLGRRALAALGELVTRIAHRHRVVVFIDDLQWGDADSAPFLTKLVTPDGPPLLFLGSFRSEHRADSALVRALFEAARLTPGSLVELPLAPLAATEIERLAATLLRRAGVDADRDLAASIATQAGGSPYFAQELARHVGSALRRGAPPERAATLKDVVLARAARLTDEARALLDVIAVAGSPTVRTVLDPAAGAVGDTKFFVELAAAHFTTTRSAGDEERIDTAHDAVREAVLGVLAPERARTLHLAVAHALESDAASSHELAEHYFQAWPDAPTPRVFELCLAAATEAAASHAYEQAYVHMTRARRVAPSAGIALDVGFTRLFGAVAARAGHMGPAAAALRSALPAATTAVEKAELHLALSRIALGQLDTATARGESDAGLQTLGYDTPRASALGVARAVTTLVGARALLRLRPETFGSLRGDARARVGSALMRQSAQTAYFRMDRLTFLQMPMRQYAVASRLGDSPELADSCASAALVAAVAGRRELAHRLMARAGAIAEVLDAPPTTVPVLEFRAHTLHFLGECVEAEEAMVACLTERGQWMENSDYLTSVAHLAWNTMMRGRPEIGWRWVLRGLERTAIDGAESRLTRGHTYLCYGGPLLAQLGRADEGRALLEDFRTKVLEGASNGEAERWRPVQWLAHWALFLVLTGDVGPAFEKALDDFAAMGFGPRGLPLVVRHAYVAQARGRLLQRERAPADGRARARFDDARRALARAADHPTLQAHLALVEARALALDGDAARAREHLARAELLAARHHNVWVAREAGELRLRLGRG